MTDLRMAGENPVYDKNYILAKLLELAYDGIVVVDANGVIVLISKAYTDFLGITEEDAVGKHVSDVIENTRLPEVLKSGREERARLQMIRGDYMVASRIPLIKDGCVVGAVGKVLFRNIDELNVLHKRVNELQLQLENYKTAAVGNRARYSFASIIGRSDKLMLARSMAEKAALTDSAVLLCGESGTGKELFAHAIHQESARKSRAFVKLNCAAIPGELLESELFGYEDGAFTGARKGGRIGKFEVADGGTLFLDEIGDMPSAMQAKLLRVLQEKEIEKIGSHSPVAVDVRIIAATNRNLEQMVEKGLFRHDLFFRLNVVGINIAPLRERPEDVGELVPSLLEKICSRIGKYVDGVSSAALELMKSASWPGNVRQLENVLELAVNMMERPGELGLEHLPSLSGDTPLSSSASMPLSSTMDDAERTAIVTALALSKGKKAAAARYLGISRSNLYQRLRRLDIK